MGSCLSFNSDNDTKYFDTVIIRDREKDKSVTKILLLGTGNSGKSTILKQFIILHRQGFTEEERKEISFFYYYPKVI